MMKNRTKITNFIENGTEMNKIVGKRNKNMEISL